MLARSHRRHSGPTDQTNGIKGINSGSQNSQKRSSRECQSICVPSDGEQNFLREIKNAGLSTRSKTHDIHVWHQNQLFRASRVFKENQTNEVEFLRKLFQILLPKESLPVDITSAFQVLDERQKSFRPIHTNELFSNGSLLKLLTNKRTEGSPQPGSAESYVSSQQNSSSDSTTSNNSPIIYQSNQLPDFPPAPLLSRKYLNSSVAGVLKKQEAIEESTEDEKTKSSSSSSPGSMHSQTAPGGTPTRLAVHSTLIPATMQVGSNGERHLILHYPDGHSVAATALPNQSGQFHLVPMISNHQSNSAQAQAQITQPSTTLRLVQAGPEFAHVKRQGGAGLLGEAHTHLVRNKAGQKVELVCTCPPELHQALRQSQIDGSNQNNRPGDDDFTRRSKGVSVNHHGWANSAPLTDHLNILSGESSETFQESDSSGGSGQGGNFPSSRKNMIPADAFLALVLNDQAKRHSKPPQTLEEAQHRIAQMENQLTQLTSLVRALHTQSGNDGCSQQEFCVAGQAPKTDDSESRCPVAHCSNSHERCSHSSSPPQSHAFNRYRLLFTYRELKELRLDLQALREIHAANTRQMHNISNSVVKEITRLLMTVQLKGSTPVRSVQLSLDNHIADYKTGFEEIEAWLADLDASIEEMRVDALNRRCRVSVTEVEAYALHLSRLSQRLASFKGQIPEICNASNLLSLVNEAEVKLQNEFLANEPKRIDAALSTCKQLTCTLFTLKRLAAVQENGISVNIPTLRTIRDPRPEDKKLYLQQICKIFPNHEARMMGLACHEKTRERRKRMLSLRESMCFEGAVERSEVNLRDILRRLNELSLDLLPSSPEQSEEEGSSQTSSSDLKRTSSNRICPIHRDSGKSSELCCETLRTGKSIRGSGDGESSTPPSSTSSEQSAVGSQLPTPPPTAPNLSLPPLPQAPRGPRRAHVVFSRTVLVDAGRETTRLNCPSDLDDEHGDEEDDYTGAEAGSDADELQQPWRRERLHRGNRVVDIHPGLPRNEYVICDGRCGAPACAQGSCLARQKGSTGSVLKTATAYGSNFNSNDRNSLANQISRITAGDFDARSIDSEESEKQLAEPTSVHEMRGHHQCCRLNSANNTPSSSVSSSNP
ncbi:hypothetical protein Aperf_G00000069229 [Anoplocephala perfoliata]